MHMNVNALNVTCKMMWFLFCRLLL